MRKATETLIVKLTKEQKEGYEKYLDWECITKTEDIRNHVRECIRKREKTLKENNRIE